MITLDGSKAGSKGTAPIFQDDFGLPSLFALVRADNFFKKHQLKNKVSLILSGGLVNPGDFLKAIAMGANAVYIGGISLFAMSQTQVLKSIPWEPSEWYSIKDIFKTNLINKEQKPGRLPAFCNEEIKDAVRPGRTFMK